MKTFKAHCLVIAALAVLFARGVSAQTNAEDVRESLGQTALDRGDYVQAIDLLSEAVKVRPRVETYLSLGIAYRRSRDWQKAEDLLEEGSQRFPQDPRIPTELANAYLAAGDVERARDALHRALAIDPVNVTAADRLAAVELSEGEVQTALNVWNRSGQPIVHDVLHNSNTRFGHWIVAKAHAFRRGKQMTYAQWRTTELRLLTSEVFSNAGIEVEPAPASNDFNPIILTTKRSTDWSTVAFGIAKGVPLRTTYLDLWDIGQSGISVNSKYRWDYNRRRGDVMVHAPLPVPSILFFTAHGVWRSERWNISNALRSDAGPLNRLAVNSTAVRAELQYIPSYKFDFGGGVEYANRYGSGGPAALLANGQNSGKVLFQTNLRLADSRYRNRIHVEGYVARKSLLGDLNYSAATAELDNQFLLNKDTHTIINWNVRGGTSRGQLPVEDYFTLSVDTQSGNLLRAHQAARHGQYGYSPMGTSFALSNFEIERRIALLPLFNTLNLPYLDVKGLFFFDGGTTWDRSGLFKEGKLHLDTGAGLRLESHTRSLNLIYGRSLREGKNVLFAYIEKHW